MDAAWECRTGEEIRDLAVIVQVSICDIRSMIKTPDIQCLDIL